MLVILVKLVGGRWLNIGKKWHNAQKQRLWTQQKTTYSFVYQANTN